MSLRLDTKLSRLKGVGEVLERELERMELVTVADLLDYFPRRYDDFTQLAPIAQLRPGLVSVRARVEHIDVRRSFKRRSMAITEAIVTDATGSLKLTWFNSPFIISQLKQGEEYLFTGELAYKGNVFGVTQPQFERPDSAERAGHIVAVYPETVKISSKLLRQLIAQVIDCVDLLKDPLPEAIRTAEGLVSLSRAVRTLHQPDSMAAIAVARRRMEFAELFTHLVTSRVVQKAIETEPGIEIPFNEGLAKEFVASLPYALTNAQRKVSWQIFEDMQRGTPMSRLLEGDVGSGKTLVAAFATLMAIRAGYQVAVMVPTVVLATQHLRSFSEILQTWGVRVELIASALKAAERRELEARIEAGEVDVVIGTQALLTRGVSFASLGLVVVDEQHRFGVNQRLHLKDKAGRLPHVLTMTATPIPRTLALVAFGDLDISILDEMPPGRVPIQTKLCRDADRAQVYVAIDERIRRGEQVYIVCPSIDAADRSGMRAATAEMRRLSNSVFKHRRIGLMHGKLKSDEKESVMADFVAGRLDILVSTTVIEVGVHVDQATVMLVESAERFGLATLHQLRGRVGRSDIASDCYLFVTGDEAAGRRRVSALEKTRDGFRLAEIDLASRGAGERFGLRQSGAADFRFASLHDAQMVARAKESATSFLEAEDLVKYPCLLEVVNRLKAVTSLD